MTCIVGWTDGHQVTIGGDSAAVSGWDCVTRADPKVFSRGPYVFGYTTSFRMGQVLRFGLRLPKPPKARGLEKFLALEFVPALRDAFKTAGVAQVENGVETCGTFLLGVRGRLFRVADDYQVGESLAPFDSVGSGAQVALGAMSALAINGLTRKSVLQALRISAAYNAAVRGPFRLVTR